MSTDARQRQSKLGRKFFHSVLDLEQSFGTAKEKDACDALVRLVGVAQANKVHSLYSDFIKAKEAYEKFTLTLEGQLK